MDGRHLLSPAEFIRLGMTKEKWPFITNELVQQFLDDPDLLEDEDEEWVQSFFTYCDWYWSKK